MLQLQLLMLLLLWIYIRNLRLYFKDYSAVLFGKLHLYDPLLIYEKYTYESVHNLGQSFTNDSLKFVQVPRRYEQLYLSCALSSTLLNFLEFD